MTSKRLFVFDTNTLVSAAILENSTPRRALRRAVEVGTLALSRETLEELTKVLSRGKLERYASMDERDEFLKVVVMRSRMVEVRILGELKSIRGGKIEVCRVLVVSMRILWPPESASQ